MKFKKGQKVKIVNAPSFPTYDSRFKNKNISGEYFIYDETIKNDRIRVTNSEKKVDTPCGMTGWVSVNDIAVDGE